MANPLLTVVRSGKSNQQDRLLRSGGSLVIFLAVYIVDPIFGRLGISPLAQLALQCFDDVAEHFRIAFTELHQGTVCFKHGT
jgi:hypothetical protein